MFTKKLLRLGCALIFALGMLTVARGGQPPTLTDCNVPQQPTCGG